MSKKRVKFYGSDEELSAFEKQLKNGGCEKCEDYPVQSVDMHLGVSVLDPGPSVSYEIVPGIGDHIKTFLSTRRQRMVVNRETIIKGDAPPDEIERLLGSSGHFDILKDVG